MSRIEATPRGRRFLNAYDFGGKPNIEGAQIKEDVGLLGKSFLRLLGALVNGFLKRVKPRQEKPIQ